MTDREDQTQDPIDATTATATATEEPTNETDEILSPPESTTGAPLATPVEPGPANVSPDGSTLAYLLRESAGAHRLWLSPLDGAAPRQLSVDATLIDDAEGPQWSPDGATLAVTGLHPSGTRTAIWLIAVDSGAARLLVDHPAADHSPRWSPDGARIAFVANRDGRDAVALAPADGSGPAVQLTTGAVGQDDRELTWSPDGGRIAFARRSLEPVEAPAGDHIWVVDVTTAETKQVTKKAVNRRSLRWGPTRPLILHVVDDGEWDNIAVVNADNSAGWTLSSEVGDKADPRWAADGNRLLYTRAQNGVVRCCDRATSGAAGEPIDPGDGVAASPRWLPDGRAVYAFGGPGQAVRFIVQERKADAERTELAPAVPWLLDRDLVQPHPFPFETTGGLKLSGLLYQQSEHSGPAPAVIVLGDEPHRANVVRFRPLEQALAAAGFAVFALNLPGTPGQGRKITNALKDQVDTEAEVSDLVDVANALRAMEGVDGSRLAVVGQGHGGALALLLAGGRPGTVQAVVAIDPVADWHAEFDQADAERRAWLGRNYGLPAAGRGRYALRTPATFVGVIDVPLLIVSTATAPAGRAAQLAGLIATIQELGVLFDQITAGDETGSGSGTEPESEWAAAAQAAAFLRAAFLDRPAPEPAAQPAVEAIPAEAVAAETLSPNGV